MRRYTLFLLLVTVLISGCSSTSPTPLSSVEPVPNSSILDSTYLNPDLNRVQLTVARDSGIAGSACSVRLFLDGVATVDLDSAEQVILYPEQGEHILSVRFSNRCLERQVSEISVVLKKNVQKKFRIGYGVYSGLAIMPTAF